MLVQTRMGVERMLGYDLAFCSMPHLYERILVAVGIIRDLGFLRDHLGNSKFDLYDDTCPLT